MFETLSERLGGVFDRLTGRGVLSERDVDEALREVRVALLEADVALPVVKTAVAKIREQAVGESVIKSVSPGQQVIKIVNDALVEMLGGNAEDPTESQLNLAVTPPAVILMAGLQGSGKTTTSGKLARYLKQRERKRVMLASLDTRRPAAMEQLASLAQQVEVDSLPIVAGQDAVKIAKRALDAARLGGYDVLILDTAGRTTLDEEMMSEVAEVAAVAKPIETLLVADSLTGQDAVRTAEAFHSRLPLTGLVLTRIDGDGRGGAALSMRSVTGLPIKFLGTSEKIDGLDAFDAKRLAGRILGQGDVVSLVEKAAQDLDKDKAEKMAKKMAKGQFDLDDLSDHLGQMQKLGGLGGIAALLPGAANIKKQMAAANLDDKVIVRQRAIISSMTQKERRKPELLNASRRRRIAVGAGVDVADVNRLMKMHKQMAGMMKKLGRNGGKGWKSLMGNMPSPDQMGDMPQEMPADMSKMPNMDQLMKQMPKGAGSLPGMPGGGLPGLPGFRKK